MGQHERQAEQKRDSRRPGNTKSKRLAFGDYRFVRIDLSSEEKDDFHTRVGDGSFRPLGIAAYLSDGYSVKFSQADGGKTVVCTLTQTNVSHPNAGLSISGRGRDTETAFAVVAYKDIVVCNDGQWLQTEYERSGTSPDIG